MSELKLVRLTYQREWVVQEIVRNLVAFSRYFEVTPLPYDCWEIAVKPESVVCMPAEIPLDIPEEVERKSSVARLRQRSTRRAARSGLS